MILEKSLKIPQNTIKTGMEITGYVFSHYDNAGIFFNLKKWSSQTCQNRMGANWRKNHLTNTR